jgi:hypothetical protein
VWIAQSAGAAGWPAGQWWIVLHTRPSRRQASPISRPVTVRRLLAEELL